MHFKSEGHERWDISLKFMHRTAAVTSPLPTPRPNVTDIMPSKTMNENASPTFAHESGFSEPPGSVSMASVHWALALAMSNFEIGDWRLAIMHQARPTDVTLSDSRWCLTS
ncbi:hypothetical protein WOLCODRAFT_158112 [Wolfiporia cocos MD-104 SS10]|uniref:Uncharacterized protein n=1 Tax=Wolfiporia cocos (strain MD-104) TaxID=742152 RepID=A0A2H3J5B3_WOLCO|nr:hypothetical protein WOLCODRAFT_158112 [Wolfiporia cocos MD-104 SS10]